MSRERDVTAGGRLETACTAVAAAGGGVRRGCAVGEVQVRRACLACSGGLCDADHSWAGAAVWGASASLVLSRPSSRTGEQAKAARAGRSV